LFLKILQFRLIK